MSNGISRAVSRALERYSSNPTRHQMQAVYMGDNQVLTRLFNGQKMYVDTRDYSESPHLITDGYWEINITLVFQAILDAGDTVFDIGSTHGYYGLMAGGQGAERIVVVDANPVYESYLRNNLTVNGLIGKSEIEMVAIGGKPGETTLHTLERDWNSATTQDLADFEKQRDVPYKLGEEITVPVTTVDVLVKKHDLRDVNVIKIDIEGLEEESYAGMGETIKKSDNLRLLMEFSPENYQDPEAFYGRIADDFEHMYVMPKGATISKISSYEDLIKKTDGGWMMLLVSKQSMDERLRPLKTIADATLR